MRRNAGIAAGLLLVLGLLFGIRLDEAATDVDARYRLPNSHFVTLPDGTVMHYVTAGSRDRPALVLVHGSFDSSFTWEELVPELSDAFYVVAPDLPGHGLTGRTPADKYNVPGSVETLARFFEAVGLSHFHLAGNSFGGNMAWRYALAHPQQVITLCLLNASGFPGLKLHTSQNPNPVVKAFYRYGNPTVMVRLELRRAVANPDVITDLRVQRIVDFLRREGSRDAQAIRATTRRVNGQPIDRLAEITQPTLILWGRKDALVPVAHARQFNDRIMNSKLVIFDDVGHLPQIEAPERTAEAMRTFIDSQHSDAKVVGRTPSPATETGRAPAAGPPTEANYRPMHNY
jgi:pimeloyl-ACP methyl ester carboxylesterase